ncbi:MAG: IclR family transcriptional regulator [Trueperaceae bacterium]|nr:IclR family transcriptional regulator [Trueperaceae bacterium]
MPSQRLNTVDRLLRLLVALAESPPQRVEALARVLRQPISTTYRYLASLKAHGVVQELSGGRYAVGPRTVQLEAAFQRAFEHANPHHAAMNELAAESGETVAFLLPLEDAAVCVATVESAYPLRYTFSKGAVKPLLRGASAKAMLPWLPEDRVAHLIDEATDLDEAGKSRLRNEIPAIRQAGHAISQGEIDAGVWTVGAPVLRADGSLIGAVSTIAPVFRVQGQEDRIVRLTTAAANRMSYLHEWEWNRAS